MSNCSNCAALQQQIAFLQREVNRLQARIEAAGKYCQENVSRANNALEGNLGMRTYGRMVATVEHLSYVADILGFVIGAPKTGVTWRSFRRFSG